MRMITMLRRLFVPSEKRAISTPDTDALDDAKSRLKDVQRRTNISDSGTVQVQKLRPAEDPRAHAFHQV